MRFPFFFGLALFWLADPGVRAQEAFTLYDDALANGWQDWSWATRNWSATTSVHGGTMAIQVQAGNAQALALHHEALNTALFENLTFWIHGGTAGGQTLQVRATRGWVAQPAVAIAAPAAGAWTQVTIPLSDLGVSNCTDFDGVWIQNSSGTSLGTFYVDDIALTFGPAPASLSLQIDAQTVRHTLDPRMYGTNLVMWDSLLTATQTGTLLRAMNFGALRFPGGSLSDDYNWQTNRRVSDNPTWTWASHVADFAKVVEAQGTAAYVIVNYGSGTPEQAAAWVAYHNGNPASTQALGTDAKGRDWKTVGYWASLRAAAPLATDDGYNFLRVSHPAAYGFRNWEVGNECYGSWEYDEHGVAGKGLTGAAHDPVTYAQAFQNFARQMLAVDPTIKIGAVITSTESDNASATSVVNPRTGQASSGWTPVVLSTLKTLGTTPHFVIYHYYAQNPGNESDFALLQGTTRLDTDAASIRQMLTDYIGGSAADGIEMTMTELNSVSSAPGKQTANLVNALFYADAYGTLAHTEYTTVLWWALHNSAETTNNNSASLYGWRPFGCYDLIAGSGFPGLAVHTPLPTYQAATLLAHWARGGDEILATTSNYALLSSHAARHADGRLSLLVVNKHPTAALTAQLALAGFIPGSATATVYAYGKDNDAPGSAQPGYTTASFAGATATFAYTFPAYSITVIELASPITFADQPANTTVRDGLPAGFTVTASGPGTLTYQWQRSLDRGATWTDLTEGTAYTGVTTSALTVAQARVNDSGQRFRCIVTLAGSGSVASTAATLTVPWSQLAALSARAPVGTGDQTLILGFVFAGGGKPTLIRGVGPGLVKGDANLAGQVLADPQLTLNELQTVNNVTQFAAIATNDNWGGTAELRTQMSALGMGALDDASTDAALLRTPTHTVYTAQVSGVGGTTGLALAEVYDANFADKAKRLTALSVRNQVGTGANQLIAGFVIAGDTPKRVILRGVGPGLLLNSPELAGLELANPTLQLNKYTPAGTTTWTVVGANDDWGGSAELATAMSQAGMGALAADSKDAVLLLELAPGVYTAQVSGVGETTGIGLVEIYEAP